MDAVLLGEGFVAYSPIQLNEYNYDGVEKYDFDLAKAEAAFLAAGCEKDAEGFWCRNGERISFTINATPGDQVRIDMAQIAAQQLQEAGLDVKANVPADGITGADRSAASSAGALPTMLTTTPTRSSPPMQVPTTPVTPTPRSTSG